VPTRVIPNYKTKSCFTLLQTHQRIFDAHNERHDSQRHPTLSTFWTLLGREASSILNVTASRVIFVHISSSYFYHRNKTILPFSNQCRSLMYSTRDPHLSYSENSQPHPANSHPSHTSPSIRRSLHTKTIASFLNQTMHSRGAALDEEIPIPRMGD